MKLSTRTIVIALVLVIGGGLIFSVFRNTSASEETAQEEKITVTVYKSPTCGCCGNYISYLKREGFDVETVNLQDLSEIKQRYGVPSSMESCHTLVAGDRFSEGHVPAEALRAFLTDPGDAAGIALPGMPSGSPGMPGPKSTFNIQRISGDGSVSLFQSI